MWVGLAIFLGVGLRSGAALAIYLTSTFLVGLACMLTVTALMPPPRKISETSALAARLFSFAKATWAAFMFTVGAVYGGMVGVSLASTSEWQSSSNGFDYLQQFVWPIVGYVAAVAGAYAAIACAIDLYRIGQVARIDAVDRLMRTVESVAGASQATAWLREFVQWWVTGWRPWVLAVLAPIVAPTVWNYVAALP